jgi:hypothetical protein
VVLEGRGPRFAAGPNSVARQQCHFTNKFSISEAILSCFFLVLFAVLI